MLNEMRSIFTTQNFRPFVKIERPFRYYAAVPGRSGTGILDISVPKFVQVVSRTDLSLNKPVADGVLIYKSKELKDHLTDMFH